MRPGRKGDGCRGESAAELEGDHGARGPRGGRKHRGIDADRCDNLSIVATTDDNCRYFSGNVDDAGDVGVVSVEDERSCGAGVGGERAANQLDGGGTQRGAGQLL